MTKRGEDLDPPPPPCPWAASTTIDGVDHLVFTFEMCEPVSWSDALTPCEREVAALLVTGASNVAIARARGRSERTIANQVASILRKLRIGSRLELHAESTDPRLFGDGGGAITGAPRAPRPRRAVPDE